MSDSFFDKILKIFTGDDTDTDTSAVASEQAAGDTAFNDGHTSHMKLLRVDQKTPMGLLVMHAEDQLMSAETFKIMAMEFIDMYKKVSVLEEKIGESKA